MDNQLTTIKLKSKTIDELKNILVEQGHCSLEELDGKGKNELISTVEKLTGSNEKFRQELENLDYSIKPSFYLLYIKDKTNLNNAVERVNIEKRIKELNGLKDKENYPSIRGYRLHSISTSQNLIEIHFLWQKIHWYWSPSLTMNHVYELNYGLALIDLASNKSIISCHTKQEREDITKVISDTLNIKLKPLHLTKPLLNQIGNYDTVKRARYFNASTEVELPQNLSLGDDNLSTKKLAREQEENSDVVRKESFYRISINSVEEQGIGVTSETGKLWIPQRLPISEIKEFATTLLSKVAKELNTLTDNGEYHKVFNSLGIPTSERLMSISNVSLREELYRLFFSIANMLIEEVSEKSFTPTSAFTFDGIPQYFNPLKIIVESDGSNYYYGDSHFNLFKVKVEDEETEIRSYIDNSKIINLIDKDTQESIDKASLEYLLVPTPKLEQLFINLLQALKSQYPELGNIIHLPFKLVSNKIILDWKRAKGKSNLNFNIEVNPAEVNELKQILNKDYQAQVSKEILHYLGEKCDHMTDDNCLRCTKDRNFVCLRTLMARTMNRHYLLAHKGIELSDLQGEYQVGESKIKIFTFAKLGAKGSNLTARNKNGAILLAQIFNQIDKSEFNTVAILTSSIINEDLLSRLKLICRNFGKKFIVIGSLEIEKLFGSWYEDMENLGENPLEIMRNSGKKLKTEVNRFYNSPSQ